MASTEPISASSGVGAWYSVFVNTVGFLIGFILGGITGYFGNWLWYRFGPFRRRPHLTMTTLDGTTSFSGFMTGENREDILRSLKAIKCKEPEKSVATTIRDVSSSVNSKVT